MVGAEEAMGAERGVGGAVPTNDRYSYLSRMNFSS